MVGLTVIEHVQSHQLETLAALRHKVKQSIENIWNFEKDITYEITFS